MKELPVKGWLMTGGQATRRGALHCLMHVLNYGMGRKKLGKLLIGIFTNRWYFY